MASLDPIKIQRVKVEKYDTTEKIALSYTIDDCWKLKNVNNGCAFVCTTHQKVGSCPGFCCGVNEYHFWSVLDHVDGLPAAIVLYHAERALRWFDQHYNDLSFMKAYNEQLRKCISSVRGTARYLLLMQDDNDHYFITDIHVRCPCIYIHGNRRHKFDLDLKGTPSEVEKKGAIASPSTAFKTVGELLEHSMKHSSDVDNNIERPPTPDTPANFSSSPHSPARLFLQNMETLDDNSSLPTREEPRTNEGRVVSTIAAATTPTVSIMGAPITTTTTNSYKLSRQWQGTGLIFTNLINPLTHLALHATHLPVGSIVQSVMGAKGEFLAAMNDTIHTYCSILRAVRVDLITEADETLASDERRQIVTAQKGIFEEIEALLHRHGFAGAGFTEPPSLSFYTDLTALSERFEATTTTTTH